MAHRILAGLLNVMAVVANPAPAATITLVLDDTRNAEPYERVHFATNVDVVSGVYAPDWAGYQRHPMHDDGQHGDGTAGDHVWAARIEVRPDPGQLFEWAIDDDDNAANGWLGPCRSFLVDSAADATVTSESMPEESYKSAAQMAHEYGLDLSTASAPRRLANSDRVLFTVHAPDAAAAYLLGPFNNWGRNKDGVVRNKHTRMFPAGGGVWYRLLRPGGDEVRYKFAFAVPQRGFVWMADPLVDARDSDGNTLIRSSALAELAPPVHGRDEAPKVGWTPFAQSALRQIVGRDGRALVYVRLKDNPRCLAFERTTLLGPECTRLLAGRSVLFLDAADPDSRQVLREMALVRVPALAWTRGDGQWLTLVHTESVDESAVVDWLSKHLTSSATP